MLSSRRIKILKYIIEQYIDKATPVPSQGIVDNYSMGVSPATIRNEMASLEKEGYIIRPYSSSGSIPSDKGYRFYVETTEPVALPLSERQLINHLFHQVETEFAASLHLAATLMARLSNNVAVVTAPKSAGSKFKRMGLIQVQETSILMVAVMQGASIRQKFITLSEPMPPGELDRIANELNEKFANLNRVQIESKNKEMNPIETLITDSLVKLMEEEDRIDSGEPYLQGIHLMLNQPEFTRNNRMVDLMELVEDRKLINVIRPQETGEKVQVTIGTENALEGLQGYSIVVCEYGLPDEMTGTIGVIGPTRMPYIKVISGVDYLASVLSQLVAEFYEEDNKTN